MSEELGSPPASAAVKVAVAPFPAEAEQPAPASAPRSIGLTPERAESMVQGISRFAGPATFFFVLGAVIWFLFK